MLNRHQAPHGGIFVTLTAAGDTDHRSKSVGIQISCVAVGTWDIGEAGRGRVDGGEVEDHQNETGQLPWSTHFLRGTTATAVTVNCSGGANCQGFECRFPFARDSIFQIQRDSNSSTLGQLVCFELPLFHHLTLSFQVQ